MTVRDHPGIAVRLPPGMAFAFSPEWLSSSPGIPSQVRDAKGKLASSVRDAIRVKLSETRVGQLASRALLYDTGFTLEPGAYTLRFLVRENQTGKMGTFESTLVIPDISAATGLKISSVVWSAQRQPVKDVVGSAGVRAKEELANPLVYDGQKLVPSVTRAFRGDQNLYVYAELYDAQTASGNSAPSVAAAVAFYRDSKKVFESAPLRISEWAAGRQKTVAVRFQAPLAKLPPGAYQCQLNLIDENGKRFAFPRTELAVIPAGRPQ